MTVQEASLSGEPLTWAGLDNDIFRVEVGRDPTVVLDDEIFLKRDGDIFGGTEITGHSRGYAKLADGVLRTPHGSRAPAYPSVATSTETNSLRTQAPYAALDSAARIYGIDLGAYDFRFFAEEVQYKPNAQYWEGLCHAWSYTSLDERINALVDVPGRVGQRGLWIFGQWISRADLGNWMMGVANQVSIADAVLVDAFVTPEDLIKGIAEFVMNSGRGMRADLWNDAESGRTSEIWNQPIFSATLDVVPVDAAVSRSIVDFARSGRSTYPPIPASPTVKLVQVEATWGVEVSDSHEGDVETRTSLWNIFTLVDTDGRIVKGFMAHHLAASGIQNLPVDESDPLPDYIAFPKHVAVDHALSQQRDALLDGGVEGKYYRFFVGTVLGGGIPNATRAAFESDFFAGAGKSDLMARFPGIANAYSPEQWRRVFEPRLGRGEDFGAVWGQAARDFGFRN